MEPGPENEGEERNRKPVFSACFLTHLLVQALFGLEEVKNLYGNRLRGYVVVFH